MDSGGLGLASNSALSEIQGNLGSTLPLGKGLGSVSAGGFWLSATEATQAHLSNVGTE